MVANIAKESKIISRLSGHYKADGNSGVLSATEEHHVSAVIVTTVRSALARRRRGYRLHALLIGSAEVALHHMEGCVFRYLC